MSLHNFSNNPTLLVVGAFLLITLAVGLYAGRGIKNIKEYALGDGRFSTFTLTLTLLATVIGGASVIGSPSEIYSLGIIAMLSWLAVGLQYILIAFFIAPKFYQLKNCLTIGDYMQIKFGKNAKLISGLLIGIKGICVTSVQLLMLGRLCDYFFDINPFWGICIGGFVLTVYSSYGGIKSVTYTDVLQFIVIIIAIPLFGSLLLKISGGYKEIFSNLPKSKFTILDNEKFNYWLGYIVLLAFSFTNILSQGVFQRILMANNPKQVRNSFLTSGVLQILFGFLVTIIGFSMIVLYPNIEKKTIVFHAINQVFQGGFMKGIILSGLLAVIMSSADSYLNSTGLVFAIDFINPLLGKRKIDLLKLSKFTTILAGVLAIVIAIKFTGNKYFRNITFYGSLFSFPILLFPLVSTILGLKSDKKSFYFSMAAGVSALIVARFYFLYSKPFSILVAVFANGLAFMISHMVHNKGIILIKRDKDSVETTEKPWKPTIEKTLNFFFSLIPTPKKIYEFSRQSVIRFGASNILFGIFCCVNFTLPYFMWDHEVKEKYDFMIYLRFIGGIMAGLCIVKDQWKEFLKPYFPLFWHATLMYCLPFVTILMFFLTNGSFTWLFNIATSIFFLILLVDGTMFLILGSLGVALGLAFYKWKFGPLNLYALGFDINYHLIYQILFPTIISLLFAYRKKFFYLVRGSLGVNLGLSLCHELRNSGLQALPATQLVKMKTNQILKESKLNKNNKYEIGQSDLENICELSDESIKHTKDTIKVVSTFEKIFMEFRSSIANPSICSMKSVIEYAIKEYHFLPGQKEKVTTILHDDFYAKVPKAAFSFVISNIIRNAYKHGRATEIKIWLENNKLHIKDNGKGIPKCDLTEVFKLFYSTGDKKTSSGVGLAFAKQLIESFYGEIWCESEEGKNSFTEFIIKLPEISTGEITNSTLVNAKNEGVDEGINKEKLNVANKMLRKGGNPGEIGELLNLTASEIQELKRKIDKKK